MRSAGHTDTHYGPLTIYGTVLAAYGVSFRPQPGLFEPGPRHLGPVNDLRLPAAHMSRRPGAGRLRWDRFHIAATCGKPVEKKAVMGTPRAVPVGPSPLKQATFNDPRHSGRDTHALLGISRSRLLRVDSHGVRIEPGSRPADRQHSDRHQAVEHRAAPVDVQPGPYCGRVRGVHDPGQRTA